MRDPARPRRLKVYYAYLGSSKTRQPMIRIGGKYLGQMKFSIGDTIEVRAEGQCLVVEKVPR